MTVNEYMTEWLEGKKPELRKSTYDAYNIYINGHIIPYFDTLGKEIEELRPTDIKRYVTEKLTGGRLDAKQGGLSSVTVRKHLNIIKQSFRDAVMLEILEKSPADAIRMRPRPSVSDDLLFISLEDANRIISAMVGNPLYDLVYVTLYYGLRRSEVLGLKWSAVDFEKDTIVIRHTVVKGSTIEAGDQTKTASSKRVFPLLPDVKELLLERKARTTNDSEYIFTWDDGRIFRPDHVTRGFQRAIKRHGIQRMRFHDLRHATASILFGLGWDVADVQHWLGHKDIETTKNIYIAYNNARKIAMGGKINGIFKNVKNA